MTAINFTLYLIAGVWVVATALLTLLLTAMSKQAAEREREHDLDERMGEE